MKILEAWEQTFKLRRKLYLNANLETIYGDFPCLRLNTGIELEVNCTIQTIKGKFISGLKQTLIRDFQSRLI